MRVQSVRSNDSALECTPAIAASMAKRPSPAAVDLVEREPRPGLVDAAGATGQAEPDDGSQAAYLGVVGVGRDEGVGDGERLTPGVGESIGRVENRPVRDREHA